RRVAAVGPQAICSRSRTVAALLFSIQGLAQPVVAQASLPPGLVYLRDIEPGIAQDIRYAGSDNFVGRPLPGYDAAECILRREVALALKQVQADLAASGLALKIYDCYRPTRAVRAMAQWAGDGRPGGASKRFFPRLPKGSLFALGYIAARSQHSMGTAIDLTLIERTTAAPAHFDPAARYGSCTGPAGERAPDNSLDMGTGYDCLDAMSHTASGAVGAEQRRRRNLLVAAMGKRGFRNYHREWWHFSYPGAAPLAAYDFPIRPRRGVSDGRSGRQRLLQCCALRPFRPARRTRSLHSTGAGSCASSWARRSAAAMTCSPASWRGTSALTFRAIRTSSCRTSLPPAAWSWPTSSTARDLRTERSSLRPSTACRPHRCCNQGPSSIRPSSSGSAAPIAKPTSRSSGTRCQSRASAN